METNTTSKDGQRDVSENSATSSPTNPEAHVEFDMPTCGEFLAQKYQEPDWIVTDFIQKKGKGDLCGSSKARKSFFALELGLSIAAGRDFLDIYKIPKPRRVAYIDLELMGTTLQERVTDATRGLGLDAEVIARNLRIRALREHPYNLRKNTKEVVAFLKNKNIDLLILDPRYKLLQDGEDENLGSGLRHFLDFRDELARVCAVLVVTHDPKGDTSEKKTVDRGAGSYYAGADFDFRMSIDEASDNDGDEVLSFVIEHEGRARAPLPTIGVRIDPNTQTFHYDEEFCTSKMTYQGRKQAARKESDKDALLKLADAVETVVEEAGINLLTMTAFREKLYDKHIIGQKRVDSYIKQLVESGNLETCPEADTESETGNKKHGKTFVSKPVYIDEYLRASRPATNESKSTTT